uniref:Dickkopf WNT signaling pathway inhibitor 3a n=1 Tax=Myripristis murdjan TaxID=586833 RepID=A0A667ZI91_9TELE
MMWRFALLLLALTAHSGAILPEIVDSGINQILEENSVQDSNNVLVEVEQETEDTQPRLEDAAGQRGNDSVDSSLRLHNLPSSQDSEGGSEKVNGSQPGHSSETAHQVGFDLHKGQTEECIIDEDCEKGRYCLYETHNSKCLPCKPIDVPCTKDEECCGEHLCLWGQCSQNATKGEAGSICQYQSDCSTDLCCAFHKALLFPVCLAKPIERERCYSPSNHLMELLSWDMEGEGPREHCPCAEDLQCQPLGRGSMCLKGQDSSEEDLTDTLYSEIDYIV